MGALIPAGARARHFATALEQEAPLRKAAAALGLDLAGWEFEDVSPRGSRQPLFKTCRLRQPSDGYRALGNSLRAIFDQCHGMIHEAQDSSGWKVTPPPESLLAREDAVLHAKAAVEAHTAKIRGPVVPALKWSGGAAPQASSQLV